MALEVFEVGKEKQELEKKIRSLYTEQAAVRAKNETMKRFTAFIENDPVEADKAIKEQKELYTREIQIPLELENAEVRLEEVKKRHSELLAKNVKQAEQIGSIKVSQPSLIARTAQEKRERMRFFVENDKSLKKYLEGYRTRSIANGGILIPQALVDMIETDLPDIGTVRKLVTCKTVAGDLEVVLKSDAGLGSWISQSSPIPLSAITFTSVVFGAYKCGAFIDIPNELLADSFVNLGNYIVEDLTQQIANSIDNAIINGTGNGQPTGILKDLTPIVSDGSIADILSGLVRLNKKAKTRSALMNRETYDRHILPQTLLPTSAGQYVAFSVNHQPYLPAGIAVYFSDYVPDDTIIIGDFSKYILVERQGLTTATTKEFQFQTDETSFKAVKRVDGKVVINDSAKPCFIAFAVNP